MLARAPLHLTAAVLLFFLTGCDEPVAPGLDGVGGSTFNLGRTDAGAVTQPFSAQFVTDLVEARPDESCGEFPRLLNIQEGAGEGTHLGRFSVRITFCFDATDILDGALTEGESLPYDNGVGTFVATNGDELHLAISGAVLPSMDPEFDFQFQDPFSFTGGTGRFANASGEGMTDSFVDQAQDRTYHAWSGVLSSHMPRRP